MKKKFLFLFSIILFNACESGTKIDPSPMIGTISQGDEKTAIVKKLAAAYRAGTFELAKEYSTSESSGFVNGVLDKIYQSLNESINA